MSTANKKPLARLQAPWNAHLYVWIFMIVLGVSPALCVLGPEEIIHPIDAVGAIIAVVLMQNLMWIAQRRCSSEDLTYWEGLLVAATSMTTGIMPITFALAFCMLMFTVAASFVYALMHDGMDARRHASIRYSRLIIAIHRRRLY